MSDRWFYATSLLGIITFLIFATVFWWSDFGKVGTGGKIVINEGAVDIRSHQKTETRKSAIVDKTPDSLISIEYSVIQLGGVITREPKIGQEGEYSLILSTDSIPKITVVLGKETDQISTSFLLGESFTSSKEYRILAVSELSKYLKSGDQVMLEFITIYPDEYLDRFERIKESLELNEVHNIEQRLRQKKKKEKLYYPHQIFIRQPRDIPEE